MTQRSATDSSLPGGSLCLGHFELHLSIPSPSTRLHPARRCSLTPPGGPLTSILRECLSAGMRLCYFRAQRKNSAGAVMKCVYKIFRRCDRFGDALFVWIVFLNKDALQDKFCS